MKNKIVLFAGVITAIGLTILTLPAMSSSSRQVLSVRSFSVMTLASLAAKLSRYSSSSGQEQHSAGIHIRVRKSFMSQKASWNMKLKDGCRSPSKRATCCLSLRARYMRRGTTAIPTSAELATYIVEKGKPPVVVVK